MARGLHFQQLALCIMSLLAGGHFLGPKSAEEALFTAFVASLRFQQIR